MSNNAQIKKALDVAVMYGGIDGAHHKAWVIDQMVRALTNCPDISYKIDDTRTILVQGESREYLDLVADAKAGEDGPDTYDWDIGIPP